MADTCRSAEVYVYRIILLCVYTLVCVSNLMTVHKNGLVGLNQLEPSGPVQVCNGIALYI